MARIQYFNRSDDAVDNRRDCTGSRAAPAAYGDGWGSFITRSTIRNRYGHYKAFDHGGDCCCRSLDLCRC